MKQPLLLCAALMSLSAAAPGPSPKPALAPVEVIAAAPAADWAPIAPSDLLVMDLAPDAKGAARRVVIQLLPAPFSQGWIGNIRALAAAKWWDGTSVNRVQDGYVVQWGDPDGEDKGKAKPLPTGLKVVPKSDYDMAIRLAIRYNPNLVRDQTFLSQIDHNILSVADRMQKVQKGDASALRGDPYAAGTLHWQRWPFALEAGQIWPTHCYGTVGVGRDYPPDTGSGAELYAVIGQAPRQLDRNIAVVGRVIEGMEHLSSLPRGTGDIGFYKTAAERVPITAIRNGPDVPGLPRYEYLSTESASFAHYADARANRRDAFYIRPAGGVDICNVPVPVRRAK
jgi:peptidylprolyl isomerase